MKSITKIVITGGPCGGKTSALERIREVFTKEGYNVVFIPETATELISGGIAPWTTNTNQNFQHCLLMLQQEKEKLFTRGASLLKDGEKILLVCDRGTLDNKAYTTKEEFSNILLLMNTTEAELLSSYDAVFHLVTAAKGTHGYTLANNAARYETSEEAAILDDKLISAWQNHPHHVIIQNTSVFNDKIENLINQISLFLNLN